LQTGQAHKYAYAVLGAGRQGTAAAYDMAKFGSASKVKIGDVDLREARRAASHVNRLIGRKVAEGARVDVRRPAQIKRFILAHRLPVLARALQSASRRFTSRFLIIAIVINCLDGISR